MLTIKNKMHLIVIYLITFFISLLMSFKLQFSFIFNISSYDKDNFSNNEEIICVTIVLYNILGI